MYSFHLLTFDIATIPTSQFVPYHDTLYSGKQIVDVVFCLQGNMSGLTEYVIYNAYRVMPEYVVYYRQHQPPPLPPSTQPMTLSMPLLSGHYSGMLQPHFFRSGPSWIGGPPQNASSIKGFLLPTLKIRPNPPGTAPTPIVTQDTLRKQKTSRKT